MSRKCKTAQDAQSSRELGLVIRHLLAAMDDLLETAAEARKARDELNRLAEQRRREAE